jgi:hypothetical protein
MRMALAALAAFVVAPVTTPNVARLVLQPAQVGKGYVMLARTDGKGVKGQVTMNLCGTAYPSEQLRTTRLQVNYLKARATIGVSNEVVTYRAGGAAQAMREAMQHAATCPNHPIDSGVKGLPKLTFRITRITDPRLLKGYLAVRIDVSGTVKGKRVGQTSYAVYQRRGNVLSGVYSFGTTTAGQRELCLHAAEESARNLRRGTSGVSSAPTA